MSKRGANGEGNIRKRPDGRWEGRYIAGHDENGKVVIVTLNRRQVKAVPASIFGTQ